MKVRISTFSLDNIVTTGVASLASCHGARAFGRAGIGKAGARASPFWRGVVPHAVRRRMLFGEVTKLLAAEAW